MQKRLYGTTVYDRLAKVIHAVASVRMFGAPYREPIEMFNPLPPTVQST